VSAGLVVPLACRGRFLGALWLDDTQASHLFTSTEINVVQGIATELAAALNMAELVGKLDLERQRFEALVGALTDGLVIVDREFRVVHVDAAAEALLGWQSSEIRGRRFYEVFEITEAEASVAWTKDRGGPAPTAKALSLRARNGVQVLCAVQPILVRDSTGDVFQILYALRTAPGAKTYAERLMESLGEVPTTRPAPPEEIPARARGACPGRARLERTSRAHRRRRLRLPRTRRRRGVSWFPPRCGRSPPRRSPTGRGPTRGRRSCARAPPRTFRGRHPV